MDQPELRASDAERQRTAERLQQAMAEGRLDVGEFEERTDKALAARTRGDLDQLVADLPNARREVAEKEVLELAAGAVGDLKRTGHWVVPPTVRVTGWLGDVLLDFSEAELTSEITTVELSRGGGDTTIVIPPDATADADGLRTGVGEVHHRLRTGPGSGRHHFVIVGKSGVGDVRVVHPWSVRIGRLVIHRYPFRLRWQR